jgi:four helix bundle protein
MNLKDKMDLVERTTNYALRIIRLYTAIPKNTVGVVIGKQLLRSGTSVGAQYREARPISIGGGICQ